MGIHEVVNLINKTGEYETGSFRVVGKRNTVGLAQRKKTVYLKRS